MVVTQLDLPFDPTTLFSKFYDAYHTCVLLESAEGPDRLARYSILGFDPVGEVTLTRGNLRTTGAIPVAPEDREAPLGYLKRVLDATPTDPATAAYPGGLMGYFGYEYVESLERLPPRRGPTAFPDFQFGLFLDTIVFDHRARTVTYVSHGPDRTRDVLAVAEEDTPDRSLRFGEPTRNVNQHHFEKMVETAKHHIVDGDIFQVVLSKRIDVPAQGHLFAYYENLKRVNPSPYMHFVKFGHRAIVGSSPEMLVRVENNHVETFPIAGTVPRGADAAADAALARGLLADEKERAEHNMLVDLARNDVGRIATYGSVHVPEYMEIQKFSHVQHIVSRVAGDLAPGRTGFDALNAVFPAGTVSGAPKVRAMEIIRDLEPDPRGPYAGAVGYFAFNGNMDSAITIRTATSTGGRVSVQAGAGIVHDSDPTKEWLETEAKARGLLAVMGEFQ